MPQAFFAEEYRTEMIDVTNETLVGLLEGWGICERVST